jgi:DNA primase
MSTWIDFKELRAKLEFESILRHYNVEVKRKGDQHHGYCPLPSHNGKRNSVSFSANLKRGIFQCFGCGAKGNLLEFAAMMEKINPQDGPALRGVALNLQQRFFQELGNKPTQTRKPLASKSAMPAKIEAKSSLPVLINEPLDFELKGLDAEHPYLSSRGFTLQTIEHFGLGFCGRGMLKNRVVIPLKDADGALVGYP